MDLNIAASSRDALQQNRTLRCLYKTKFQEESRRAELVIAWAQQEVEQFSHALLRGIDGPPPPQADDSPSIEDTFDVKLNVVSLLHNDKTYIMFDIFLRDCDDTTRARINKSLEEPIHLVVRRNGTHFLQRDTRLDETIGRKFRQGRNLDKGPRPLFSDLQNPPLYVNGTRVDEDAPRSPTPEDAQSDGEDDYVETEEDIIRWEEEEKALQISTEEYGAATPPHF